MTFKYKTVLVGRYSQLEYILEIYGKEGWRLISTAQNNQNEYTLFFEKRIEEYSNTGPK